MVQQKQKYKSKFKMVLITLFKIKLDQELLNKTLIDEFINGITVDMYKSNF